MANNSRPHRETPSSPFAIRSLTFPCIPIQDLQRTEPASSTASHIKQQMASPISLIARRGSDIKKAQTAPTHEPSPSTNPQRVASVGSDDSRGRFSQTPNRFGRRGPIFSFGTTSIPFRSKGRWELARTDRATRCPSTIQPIQQRFHSGIQTGPHIAHRIILALLKN